MCPHNASRGIFIQRCDRSGELLFLGRFDPVRRSSFNFLFSLPVLRFSIHTAETIRKVLRYDSVHIYVLLNCLSRCSISIFPLCIDLCWKESRLSASLRPCNHNYCWEVFTGFIPVLSPFLLTNNLRNCLSYFPRF